MKTVFNKLATGALVAAMAFTTLAPVTTLAAENDCKHDSIITVDTKEATCTEPGLYNEVCEICGEVLQKDLVTEPSGHNFTKAIIKDGKASEVTCERCGVTEAFTPTVDESECTHPEESEYCYNYVETTCTKDGYTGDVICNDCGKVIIAGKAEKATGHDWTEGDYVRPTCTEDGSVEYTCENCGETKTEVVKAAGHSWDAGKVTLAPTTTKEGVKTFTCTACGETKTESIDKIKDDSNSNAGTTTGKKDETKPATGTTTKKENTKPAATKAKVGTKLAAGGNTYVVTKVGSEVRFSKAKFGIKSLSIPATIKVSGITYKVTSISANAVKNNKKIKSATIGANVKSIAVKAFNNCPNLKKVTVKSTKLTKKTASKKSFNKVNKKMVVKVPKKVKKTYVKIFKGFTVK